MQNKPNLILDTHPYAYTVILFRRVTLNLLSTLDLPLLCWTEKDPNFDPEAAFE
jgi:hypothetical protein